MTNDNTTKDDKKKLVWPDIVWSSEQTIQSPVISETIPLIFHKSMDELLDDIKKEYPHISHQLSLLIGHVEFETAISKFIVNERGTRDGFPKHILESLLRLSQLHTNKYGYLDAHVVQPVNWR